MKTFYAYAFALLLTTIALAQPPDSLWSRTFGGTDDDHCYSVQQTTDGGYILAGVTKSFGHATGDFDFWLVKTDSTGDSLWSQTFGSFPDDFCYSVRQTTDGGYILGGSIYSYDDESYDFWLVKTDSSGDSLWSRNIGIGSSGDLCTSVQQTADGGYILAGDTYPFNGANRCFGLVKTDSSGDSLWSRTFWYSCDVWCRSVQQTVDGGYILAGYTFPPFGDDRDFWVVKTDSNGNSLWSRVIGDGIYGDVCHSAQQTADGGYILAGYTYSVGGGNSDLWLVKIDSVGDSLWSRIFRGILGGIYDDYCYSVRQTADGGYILGGYTVFYVNGTPTSDAWLVKTDAIGDSLWSRSFGGSSWDYCTSLQQTADGGYILGGTTFSFGAGSSDFWLMKTRPECYGPPASPLVRLATVGADARVYWSSVTEDTFGCSISVTHYLIFRSPTFAGPYYYHDYTADTTYTDVDVVSIATSMFYAVTATTAPLPLLQALPEGEGNLTREEVLRRLSGK